MTENAKFNCEGILITFDELVGKLLDFIKDKPEREYKIVVGTDSRADKEVHLITAVSIVRVGNGGRYFWTKSGIVAAPTMRDRIYKEAMYSIAFTQELKSRLKDKLGDVGQKGPTKELVDAVVGMVKGYGFEAVIKPDSYGAFVLADRHT
ncbi:MAG: hypothetical protein UW74_C0049G0011 [Candidatus Giovannonibacteria bacterium GW2011_GWC2_44_8]|uniref:Uncharacterized protein n=1 Tax=Candidatus Giovannonibacteria bacterium GW2011_GWC2_44_8 TaxID=1618657 RepID=A0A0G1M8A6_9BACT|nr:MAG: hypothetical protein UW74_C0049G0011 [Candidatus Giovannonibacteria bacterium GW2011_GWC2_44_8]